MFRKNHRQHKKLHNQAYLAFDAGDLQTAADKFAELAKAHPDNAQYRYMLGLAAKYRMDWALSLQANLAAIACAPEFDEAAHWNASTAATALHDWQTAHPPAGAPTAKAAKSWYSTHWNVGGSRPAKPTPLSYNARLKPIRTHCPNNRCTQAPTPKIGPAASASSACAAATARRTITNITHLPNRAHGRPSAASASPPEVWPTHKHCWTTGRHRQTAGRFGKSSRRITPSLGIPKAASGGKTTMKTTNRHAKRRGIPPSA